MIERVRKATVVERLQKLVDEASELNPEDYRTRKFMKWTADVYSAFFHKYSGKRSVERCRSVLSDCRRRPGRCRERLSGPRAARTAQSCRGSLKTVNGGTANCFI